MRRLAAALVLAAAGTTACGSADAGQTEVVVLGAASLAGVLADLVEEYEQATPGTTVVLSTGGSSGLARSVVNGLPADLLVVASPESLQPVLDADEARGVPVVVARNRVEIVVPAGGPAGVTGLADFARPELTLALCAPQVPCGAAAARALAAAGVTAAPDTLEQDVTSVLTKVRLGEVDAGVVYATDVLSAGAEVRGIAIEPPVTTDYPAVLLRGGEQLGAAQDFLDLLRSPAGRAALTAAGFEVP